MKTEKQQTFYTESLDNGFAFCCVETNCKIVTEERGLQDICQAMDRHSQDVELVEAACSALWSLSMEGISTYLFNR